MSNPIADKTAQALSLVFDRATHKFGLVGAPGSDEDTCWCIRAIRANPCLQCSMTTCTVCERLGGPAF